MSINLDLNAAKRIYGNLFDLLSSDEALLVLDDNDQIAQAEEDLITLHRLLLAAAETTNQPS